MSRTDVHVGEAPARKDTDANEVTLVAVRCEDEWCLLVDGGWHVAIQTLAKGDEAAKRVLLDTLDRRAQTRNV